jgi:hypothetical protein
MVLANPKRVCWSMGMLGQQQRGRTDATAHVGCVLEQVGVNPQENPNAWQKNPCRMKAGRYQIYLFAPTQGCIGAGGCKVASRKAMCSLLLTLGASQCLARTLSWACP